MSKLIGQVDLPRGGSGEMEVADVFHGLHDRHLRDHEELWRPELWTELKSTAAGCRDASDQLDEAKLASEMARLTIGDALWDWRKFHRLCSSNSQHDFVAIECAGRTQGLMLLESEDHATRLATKGRGLVYVELVSVAPWNRHRFGEKSEFRGVGRVLIATAVSFSIERGFDGRIGLHSLPGVEGFYRDGCGMTDLGSDSKKGGMVYFEMSEQQAERFLAKKSAKGASR